MHVSRGRSQPTIQVESEPGERGSEVNAVLVQSAIIVEQRE